MNRTSSILTALALMLAPIMALAQSPNKNAAQKLNTAEKLIENFYVDEVDMDSIVEQGIIAMLKTLDPHSVYSTPDETKDLTEPLDGKFSGIGVQFNMSTDTVYIIQTIAGGPSQRVGIQPGDRIIAADDSIIAGRKLTNRQIIKTLRGPKGSKVNLRILRGDELIDFVVVRDDIPLHSVDAVYMVTPEIGYISLSRFAEESPEEVYNAILKLKAQGMTKLILNLEGNGGGYLGSAVNIASMFLPKGSPVVYTMGRSQPETHYNVETPRPLFDGDLVVMVNQYSASASEILSGALQDNDRATIVGRRTFGKGLVQRPFPLSDGSMIRLTTARYYTPTGRCIQKPYQKGHGDEYSSDIYDRYNSGELFSADSIKFDDSQVYHTLYRDRVVYGGGGIMPDVFVPLDTTYTTKYYRNLVAKNLLNPFILSYIDQNRRELTSRYKTDEQFDREFQVSDLMVEDLLRRADEAGIERDAEQIERAMPLIRAVIKGLLMRDLYEDGIYDRAINPLNPTFTEAVRILSDGSGLQAAMHDPQTVTRPRQTPPINQYFGGSKDETF